MPQHSMTQSGVGHAKKPVLVVEGMYFPRRWSKGTKRVRVDKWSLSRAVSIIVARTESIIEGILTIDGV